MQNTVENNILEKLLQMKCTPLAIILFESINRTKAIQDPFRYSTRHFNEEWGST